MYPEFDIVIPLFQMRWNTRAVLEGLTLHYKPRHLHIITPGAGSQALREAAIAWEIAPLTVHDEEPFFQNLGLDKDTICAEIDLGQSLYNPGWFYQQLLKLGAFEGIDNLSEWYLVWDSDLLPVKTWDAFQEKDGQHDYSFALIQHNAYGNPAIVGKWEIWINKILGVEAATDVTGTFVPHHMWFKQEHLQSFAAQINTYYQSDDHWLLLMMRSANEFGTFSEFWAYCSWVMAIAPDDLSFYPYEIYGETTERFFDDGTGMFSAALRRYQDLSETTETQEFAPDYPSILSFIRQEYGEAAMPSSLSFESSPRHLKKNEETMHIEERRSRWNPRMAAAATV